ncbi:winged helix-turn-helix transcriptional regulator [Francisella marina]|uniref:Helix-turn-helix transcriptional regulator n=1 Tax=Francisella marina TaxID=2249302 RepID=A0ABX5ZHQ3_9GAMM|nr:helix-turn-helix domain-containing protein [Francisella marina]QEO57808.1 helix-turn-helix transcriptional regulator [Francisella marina]QEO59965.1 helix-turn-helix transcriptional regulator [Francisella marina]
MIATNKNVTEDGYSRDSCKPFREILGLIGDKWSIILISILEDGTKRYSQIQRDLREISPRILSLKLRELERCGLVFREVEPTVPPSVFYSLTDLGKSLLIHTKNIIRWVEENQNKIEQANVDFNKLNSK